MFAFSGPVPMATLNQTVEDQNEHFQALAVQIQQKVIL